MAVGDPLLRKHPQRTPPTDAFSIAGPVGSPRSHLASPVCIWLTGLPASGKTTLAEELVSIVRSSGRRAESVDGDQVRSQYGHDLGFSETDRHKNVMRMAHLAVKAMSESEIVIVAAVSPFRAAREEARAFVSQSGAFFEVWVSTPVSTCARRDPKGLYERAFEGELTGLTGVDGPYEPPERPDLDVDCSGGTPAFHAREVLRYVESSVLADLTATSP